MWLDDQYGVCRTAEPRHPPVRRGDRAPGQYPVSGRSGLAGSVGSVPGVSQFRATPREFAPAVVGPRSHQGSWLSQGVAAGYTGDGGGIDGSVAYLLAADNVSRLPPSRLRGVNQLVIRTLNGC